MFNTIRKCGTRKVKWLLVAVFMLASATALILSNSETVCAFGFCQKCVAQCWNESGHVYYECRDNGGTVAECDAQSAQYYRNCGSMFCPGCPVPPNGVPQN